MRPPSSRLQVSLARSPPVRDADGACVGLLLASFDRTLVVKEISSEEVAEMHNILSEYHQVGVKALVGLPTPPAPISCINKVRGDPGCRRNVCPSRSSASALHWTEVHLYFIHD